MGVDFPPDARAALKRIGFTPRLRGRHAGRTLGLYECQVPGCGQRVSGRRQALAHFRGHVAAPAPPPATGLSPQPPSAPSPPAAPPPSSSAPSAPTMSTPAPPPQKPPEPWTIVAPATVRVPEGPPPPQELPVASSTSATNPTSIASSTNPPTPTKPAVAGADKAVGQASDDENAGAGVVLADPELLVGTVLNVVDARLTALGADPITDREQDALVQAWGPVVADFVADHQVSPATAALTVSVCVLGPRIVQIRQKRAQASSSGDDDETEASPTPTAQPRVDAKDLGIDVDDLKTRLGGGVGVDA